MHVQNVFEANNIEEGNELDFQVIDRINGRNISKEELQRIKLVKLKIDSVKELKRLLYGSKFKSKTIRFILYYAPIDIVSESFFKGTYQRSYIGVNTVEGYPEIDTNDFYKRSYPWLAFEKKDDSLIVHIDSSYHRFLLDASINQDIERNFLVDRYPDLECLADLQIIYSDFTRAEKAKRDLIKIPDCIPKNFQIPLLDFYDTLQVKTGFASPFWPNGDWRRCAHEAEKQYRERYLKLTQNFIQNKKTKAVFPRITCERP